MLFERKGDDLYCVLCTVKVPRREGAFRRDEHVNNIARNWKTTHACIACFVASLIRIRPSLKCHAMVRQL
jgi:hypothetical protein